ncbi:MAG: hypothetical protein AAF805_04355 [Planctomycetota bacterium]
MAPRVRGRPMNSSRHRWIGAAASAAVWALAWPSAVNGEGFLWASRPYDVSIVLEADTPDASPERLAEAVALRLDRRVRPFWTTTVALAGDGNRPSRVADKVIAVSVRRDSAGGYCVSASERDAILSVQGPEIERVVTGSAELPEAVVEASLAAFRPVAQYDRDPENPGRVRLAFRAAELPAAITAGPPSERLLTPYVVRRREGEGPTATRAAWTYLLIDSSDGVSARVVSHTRRPFRSGRRGRVERLAIATRSSTEHRETLLRLHKHDDPSTPLPGYQVFVGAVGDRTPRPVGFTDRRGELEVTSSSRLAWATVRCGEVTVAMTPFAPGVDRELVLPLLDERPRLRAEATLSALREELIDTVARKKILAGRVRKAIADGRLPDARRELDAIEGLPGPTAFARRIDAAERSSSAKHPIARQRLEKLFANTRTVLSKALDPRETRELAIAVARAEEGASGG